MTTLLAYIMILWTNPFGWNTFQVVTIPFDTEDACEAAKLKIASEAADFTYRADMICVEQSNLLKEPTP